MGQQYIILLTCCCSGEAARQPVGGATYARLKPRPTLMLPLAGRSWTDALTCHHMTARKPMPLEFDRRDRGPGNDLIIMRHK